MKDGESGSSCKSQSVSNMSSRQQLLYALEKSKETNQGETRSVPDDQMNELIEFVQDELSRKTLPAPSKQDQRSKLMEESLKFYRPIKKLVFLERKHMKPANNEIMVCSCKPPVKVTEGEYAGHFTVGCGKKCLNRVVSTECCSSLCPAGENCTNRRFQLYQYVQVYPIKTQNRGWGLAAGQFIRKGQFVIEYLGEVFNTDSDLGQTRLNKYKTEPCTYLMSTSHNEVIDPARKGNMARFINHSCDPNCETQKWNVMGEVCVGIFAKKHINEDEELTFDYRLDTHKTQLTKCLCGSKNCRQYLGLIPSNYSSAEQWFKKLKSIKCTFCRRSSGNDDRSLILCDKCNKGWHINCLKVPLKAVPEDSWICEGCCSKTRLDDEKKKTKRQEAAIKVYLERRQFDIIRKHLEEIIELDVKLFWDNNFSPEGKIEVLIRGVNAKLAEKLIQEHSRNSVISSQVEDEVTEIQLIVEIIYLKNILNFYKTLNITANIDYVKTFDLEQIYSINQTSELFITGRKREVMSLAESILDYVDHLVIFTLHVSNTEASVFEQNLFSFKSMIFPVEVRVSQDKVVNESPHPFFFYSREERKIVFIGTEQQITGAYLMYNAWITSQFHSEIETHFHFILPTRVSPQVKKIRKEFTNTEKSLQITPKIKTFDPILPRKYLTVEITGSWKQIIEIKNKILAEVRKIMGEKELEEFFVYVQSQMFRHIFKNSAKFVHAMEKYLNSMFFPMNDSKKVYILKFWDVYSAEILLEGKPNTNVDLFRNKVMKLFDEDVDSLINLLRLCENEAQVEFLLKNRLRVSFSETLKRLFLFFLNFHKEFEGREKVEYNDFYLNLISQNIIDESDLNDCSEMDVDKITDKIISDIRQSKDLRNYFAFPTSFSSDIDLTVWEPPNYSKLSAFFWNLASRKIILGTDINNYNQIISTTTLSSDTKDKADLMIGSSKNSNNFLYVVFPVQENK